MKIYYLSWDTRDDNSIRSIVDVQWDGHCGFFFQNGQCSGPTIITCQKINPQVCWHSPCIKFMGKSGSNQVWMCSAELWYTWTLGWTWHSVHQKIWTLDWTLVQFSQVHIWTLVQDRTSASLLVNPYTHETPGNPYPHPWNTPTCTAGKGIDGSGSGSAQEHPGVTVPITIYLYRMEE